MPAVHQLPSSCHVCGSEAQPDTGRPRCGHYLTNAEADAAAREHDRRTTFGRTPEAAYVAEHRPY